MLLATGANPFGIKPELLLALIVADSVWRSHNKPLVVTSLNDGKHSRKSLHYAGCAADLRTHYFLDGGQKAADQLRVALGNNPDYDIALEDDHIHLEYQPKFRAGVT